jgi:hypothetical protein
VNAFDEKLRNEAASWRAANAPKGLPTCPNCTLKERAPENQQGPGGETYHCYAKPVLPAFVGMHVYCPDGLPVNLGMFDPASPYAERLNATVCPLFRGSPA